MEPKIYSREALLIAGVSGSGDETARAWEAFMKLTKLSPLTNQAGEEGYEIRLYAADGQCRVHVGLPVKDQSIPSEYQIMSLPGSLYAEFEIRPSRGYTSSNATIDRWLADNTARYKERLLADKHLAVEVYDKRYKGEEDPESVVGILIPVVPVE
jgi:predicted transcriptional regulator YdeE